MHLGRVLSGGWLLFLLQCVMYVWICIVVKSVCVRMGSGAEVVRICRRVCVCVVLFFKHSENICIPLNPACVALIISCMHQGFLSARSHSSSHITHDWRGGSHGSPGPASPSSSRAETIKGSMTKGKNWYVYTLPWWFSTIYELQSQHIGAVSLWYIESRDLFVGFGPIRLSRWKKKIHQMSRLSFVFMSI